MKKTITVDYRPKDAQGDFRFGNVSSEYGATERYFTRGGLPILPVIGEFHFSRCDRGAWAAELQKIKAQGLDGVSVYVFWNHHEIRRGVFDFTGNKDIYAFLKLCEANGLSVILRIGPWCHGEVRYGGFPDYLRFVPAKRKSSLLYLKYVTRWWSALYRELKDLKDGVPIIGIQLENEYGGSIAHIEKLREIAEEIGFKTPYFTMTAWPTNAPNKRFVPMCGGYPEAPWTQHKKPLVPSGRFAIVKGRLEADIGEDLIGKQSKKADFSEFPYAGCEVGTGNQVTAHRRPVISDKDGYGVAFAKFASGMNLMGYYMYRGGRNPEGKPMQESRRTFYPNNYPVIDYDFQAPLSKDGFLRKHAHRLRLMHYFIKYYDETFARTDAFFPKETSALPYCSVRADETGGIVFIGNYERGLPSEALSLDLEIAINGTSFCIPNITVPKDAMFFFPYCAEYDGVKFDYITAQPILKTRENGGLTVFFMIPNGIVPKYRKDGETVTLTDDTVSFEGKSGTVTLTFLNEDDALKLYYTNGKCYFSDGAVLEQPDGSIVCDLTYGQSVTVGAETTSFLAELPKDAVRLEAIPPKKLPYNSFLYSKGKRSFYRIKVDQDTLLRFDDLVVSFSVRGLNLQTFHSGTLVDDYFNTDGRYVLCLNRLKERLLLNNELIIKIAAAANFGAGNVYNEIGIVPNETDLKILSVTPTVRKTIKL